MGQFPIANIVKPTLCTYRFTNSRTSDDGPRYYSLENAKEVLGYEPLDDSTDWTDE